MKITETKISDVITEKGLQEVVTLFEGWDEDAQELTSFEVTEYFDKRGHLHNSNGPAEFLTYLVSRNREVSKKKQTGYEKYFKHGALHCEDGPASIEYNSYGEISSLWFYKNNILHCDDGPAIIFYDGYPVKETRHYFIDGHEIHESKLFGWYEKNDLIFGDALDEMTLLRRKLEIGI